MKPSIWAALGAGLAATLYLFTRSSGSEEPDVALTPAQLDRLPEVIPPAARPYLAQVLAAAVEYNLDPLTLLAIGERESRWGLALRPQGPAGTGDFASRNPSVWGFALPPDGLGWGRGLMQLDYENAKAIAWQDAETNIRAGAAHLRGDLDYFLAKPRTPEVALDADQARRRQVLPGIYPDVRPLPYPEALEAAVASYNAGRIPVLWSLGAGRLADLTTTGGNYSADVLGKVAQWAQALS